MRLIKLISGVQLLAWLAMSAGAVGVYYGVLYRTHRRLLRQRLERLLGYSAVVRKGLLAGLRERFEASGMGQRIAEEMARSNLELSPSQYALAYLAAIAVASWLGHMLFRIDFPLNITIGWLVAYIGVQLSMRARRQKVAEALDHQLAEVARLLANTLKAGLSVQQGVERAAHELAAPAGPVFRRVSQELRLGVPFEQALVNLTGRVRSREVELLCRTILVQHGAGGDLAMALDDLAVTFTDRERVRQEVSAATAESRFVAVMLPAMSVMAAFMLNAMIPGFINVLFTLPGMVVLAGFVVLQVVGLLIVKRLAAIKV